jgi:hypothetical protein
LADKCQTHNQRPATLSGEYSGHFSETFVTRVMSKQFWLLSKAQGHAVGAGDLGGQYIGLPLQ